MIENETFKAFALAFPQGEGSPPTLVARGEFDMAKFMISVARKYGVPVVEKGEMCAVLEEIEIGQAIPQRLYAAAAAILSEIGAIQRSKRA
jgi:type III secretion system FlhB-like substrate exporter